MLQTLHVLVIPDASGWFAQGVEMDYGTQGNTPDQAMERFKKGLIRSCELQTERFGHIAFEPAPDEVLKEARETDGASETLVTMELPDKPLREGERRI